VLLYEHGERTSRTYLRIPTPDTYEYLFGLALQAGPAWPWAGRPISVESFPDTLWAGTSANCVVGSVETGEPIGFLSLDKLSLFHGTAYLNVYFDETQLRRGYTFEAVLLFVDRVFERTPLRKLYMESIGETFESYSSTQLLVEEARFVDHLRVGGGFGDLVVSALFRDTWMAARDLVMPRIVPPKQ